MSLFRIDLRFKNRTIGACVEALSMDFVVGYQFCPNNTVRHERAFEQEATEHTEMGSVLCFLGYLLLDFEATLFRAADEDSISSVLCVSWAKLKGAVAGATATESCRGLAGDF